MKSISSDASMIHPEMYPNIPPEIHPEMYPNIPPEIHTAIHPKNHPEIHPMIPPEISRENHQKSTRQKRSRELYCSICRKNNHNTSDCFCAKQCMYCSKIGHLTSMCKFLNDRLEIESDYRIHKTRSPFCGSCRNENHWTFECLNMLAVFGAEKLPKTAKPYCFKCQRHTHSTVGCTKLSKMSTKTSAKRRRQF